MKKRRAQKRLRIARSAAVACLLCGNAVWAAVPPAAASAEPAVLAAVSTSAEPAGLVALPDVAASKFAETCSGCHTVGGGALRGPDLAGVATWPEPQLAAAVKSMERKVGPLSAEQLESLVSMLKDSTVQQRIVKAKTKFAQLSDQPRQPADSRLGGAIFFGHVALQNGGMPCSSCHRYRGEGGELGPELSQFADHSELEALAGTIARAGFPVMRAAYADHPISEQEARHLAAFMQQAKSKRIVAVLSDTTVWGLGAGLAAFGIAVAFILARPKGVRARLIQRTTKR